MTSKDFNDILKESFESFGVSEHNQKLWLEYFDDMQVFDEVSPATVLRNLDWAKVWMRCVDTDLDKLTETDLKKFYIALDNHRTARGKPYSDVTKGQYKVALKRFLNRYGEKTENAAILKLVKQVKKGKNGTSNNRKRPENMLSPTDVLKLVDCAGSTRDKAVIAVLYDSGCRLGELANCKLKSIQWNSNGYWLTLTGKTGERRVPLVWSTQYMRAWVDIHPEKKNLESPLLVRERHIQGVMTDFEIAKSMIKKIVSRTAEKASLKQHVYPHLFRHSRATHLAAAGWNESELRKFLGWAGNSDMPATYIHMGDRDMENSVLTLYGLAEKRTANVMQIDKCPRCKGLISDPDANYCPTCSFPITKAGEDADEVLATKVFELMQKAGKL